MLYGSKQLFRFVSFLSLYAQLIFSFRHCHTQRQGFSNSAIPQTPENDTCMCGNPHPQIKQWWRLEQYIFVMWPSKSKSGKNCVILFSFCWLYFFLYYLFPYFEGGGGWGWEKVTWLRPPTDFMTDASFESGISWFLPSSVSSVHCKSSKMCGLHLLRF